MVKLLHLKIKIKKLWKRILKKADDESKNWEKYNECPVKDGKNRRQPINSKEVKWGSKIFKPENGERLFKGQSKNKKHFDDNHESYERNCKARNEVSN